jgi:very-short-patch-repair endonuclease
MPAPPPPNHRAGVGEGTRILTRVPDVTDAYLRPGGPPAHACIEDVRPGDLVMTHRGRLRRVLDVHRWPHRGPVVALRRQGCAQTLWVTLEALIATRLPPLPAPEATVDRARELRKAATPGEDLLWQLLRDSALGRRFRRQHIFGPFVIDFYCRTLRLAVELDGSVHDEPAAQAWDRSRQRAVEQHGVEFLRIKTGAIERQPERVMARIAAAIARRETRVEGDRLWVPAARLRVGDLVCHGPQARSAVVESIARGAAARAMYALEVEEDGSSMTEVCTIRAPDDGPSVRARGGSSP